MHLALGLFALVAQASGAMTTQKEQQQQVITMAKQLAREMVALRYIMPGIESDKEMAVVNEIKMDHEKRLAVIEQDVAARGGKIDMAKLLKKVAADSMNVEELKHDEASVTKELSALIAMRSVVNQTSLLETEQSSQLRATETSGVYYYFEDYDRTGQKEKKEELAKTIMGGSTEITNPDLDLDPYDQLHEDQSKSAMWYINKFKGKGKGKFKGKGDFAGKGKGKFKGKVKMAPGWQAGDTDLAPVTVYGKGKGKMKLPGHSDMDFKDKTSREKEDPGKLIPGEDPVEDETDVAEADPTASMMQRRSTIV